MAGKNIADIEDLLVEILSRVPARSVIRFKCVNRQWRDLISHNRRFSLLHAQRHPTPPCSGLFVSSSSPAKELDFFWLSSRRQLSPPPPGLALLDSRSSSMILQSCNGLLLCFSNSGLLVVCNPTTNRIASLPEPELGPNRRFMSVSLAFDTSRWNDYKAILVRSDGVLVYSPATGRWEMLIEQSMCNLRAMINRGVYWNGKVLWTGLRNEKSLLLDLERGKLLPFELPCNSFRVCYFGESMGHLYLAAEIEGEVSVFELEEGQGMKMAWSKKYRVNVQLVERHLEIEEGVGNSSSGMDDAFSWPPPWIRSVVRAEDEEEGGEEGCFLVCSQACEREKVIIYNCRTQAVRYLSEFDCRKSRQFMETLYWI